MAVFVLVRRAPASCFGFYSQNVNALKPTLGSFCFSQASACIVPCILLTGCEHFETNTWQFLFWSGQRLHRAFGFYPQNVNTLRPTLGSFVFLVKRAPASCLWILLTDREHFETNTWDARGRKDTHRKASMLSETFLARR